MAEEFEPPVGEPIPTDLPGEELNARIDPVEGYLPAMPQSINTYRSVVGNPIVGSNPAPPNIDFEKASDDRLRKLISTPQEGDEYYKMRPYTYSGDTDAINYDRYYGTKAYKTLGFSPHRDNESLYNEKMTLGDQFTRSFSQWDNLLWTGFKSGVRTWKDIFTDPLAPDLQSAKEMQKAMSIGAINTGGIGGFIGNTILNGAYGIGIGLEFLAEEAALTAATAFTGGLAGEATAPAMLARGAMFGKQLAKIGEYGAKFAGKTAEYAKSFEKGMEGFKTVETAAELSKNIAKTEDAIEGVSSARSFYNKALSGAFDFVNPFEETFASLKSTQYANSLAKTIGTSGAFIDDIIRIKTAASEAKLEGGMVQIDTNKKLIDQYREENGKDPIGQDLIDIENLAKQEGERTTLYNYPAILSTNKLLFSTILYPLTKMKGNTSSRLLYDIFTEDGVKATSQNIFKKLGKSSGDQIKAAAKSLLKPKVYGTYGMNYLKANIAEGVQENIQEAISQGAIEHALAVHKDPAMAAFHGYSGYFMRGLQDQMSAQGAETFASGFLMGMFTQPIMTAPTWAMAKGIERLKSKEVRDKIKQERDAAIDAEANTLNDLANNDLAYWYSDAGTAVKNNALNTDMLNQASIGDVKGARDSQFAIEFHHMAAVADNGRFDTLMKKLEDYKNLTPKEALEAFKRYNIGIETEEDAASALKHIDSVIDRAHRIKDQFDEVASKFPNYYKLTGLSPNSPEYTAMAVSYRAWQEAQRNLIFAKSAFDEYGRRVKGMNDAFSALSTEIAKGNAQTLQSLMTMPNLKMEISTLKREISSLGDLEGQAQVKKDKQKILDLMQNFQESIQIAQDRIASEKITDYLDKQAVYGQAKKDFQKLLGHLAKKNDTILFDDTTDKAFGILTDNLEMRNEMQGLAISVNVLNSPKGFLNLQNRIFEALDKEARSENRLERIRENIYKFHAMNDENEILQSLGKLGLKLPEDFIEEYKKALDKGEELPVPDRYIDPSTGKEIDYFSDGDRYLKADELWQAFRYWMQETRKRKPEEIEAEKKKAADVLTAIQFDPKVLESFPAPLAENLKQMHLADIESGEIAKDETLKDYVETNPKALQEIKLYKMQIADTVDWTDLIEKATSSRELDSIMDQIDKVNGMTPDLINAISKKRDSFKPAEPSTTAPTDIKAKKADIERRRQEEFDRKSPGNSVIAADYLFTGGRDVMLSTDYLLQALTGAYPAATKALNNIRSKYASQIGNIKDDVGTDVYNSIMEEIRQAIKETYTNPRAEEIFNKILENATGFTFREGNTISAELEKINEENDKQINAKYDAELATLEEAKSEETKKKPEPTSIEELEAKYKDTVEKEKALAMQQISFEKKDSKKKAIVRRLTKRLKELEKQHKKELKDLGVKPVRKKAKAFEGPVYTANLSGGKIASFNPETGNWEFMTKTGKLVTDNQTIRNLSEELANQGNLVNIWWTTWLTPEQRSKVKEDINSYVQSAKGPGVDISDFEFDQTTFLMEALSGAKFSPQSLEGEVTDVNMKAWTKPNSKNTPDTFLPEEDLMSIGLDAEDLPNAVFELIERYPNGITAADIKQRKQELINKVDPDEGLRDRFIADYGLNPNIVIDKLLKDNLLDFEEETKGIQGFNELSIPEKFSTVIDELKGHAILEGYVTMDNPTTEGPEYVYRVTLDDGRTLSISSEYYFAKAIPMTVYRNNPRVRLVLAEFDGKPAVEVRIMQEGEHMDQRLTYVREKLKATEKPAVESTETEVDKEEVSGEMTLAEMNKNISLPVLLLARKKGYDVIYQNVPYLVAKVSEKTVSLKSMDGKTVTANISDITEIRDGKGIIKDQVDIEMAKINQSATGLLTDLDDTLSLDEALNNIKTNKCNDAGM